MSWRTVIVDSTCKLSYKNGYIVLKKERDSMIHISEIDVLVIATTQVTFTCVALNELIKNKVKIIFCDEKHNPLCETVRYYGSHNCAKRIKNQVAWDDAFKKKIFKSIVEQKISNQAKVLKTFGFDVQYQMLCDYRYCVEDGDITNREGHAAKVYFNALFGDDFTRTGSNAINSALDYGYTILLSYINREVVSNGCLTQLGVGHCNEFNEFNLSCDLIEPFRQEVDLYVVRNLPPTPLSKEYKYALIGLLSKKVQFYGKETFLSNAITTSVKSVLDALDKRDLSIIKLYEL